MSNRCNSYGMIVAAILVGLECLAGSVSVADVAMDLFAGSLSGNPPDTFTNLGEGGVGVNGTRIGVASTVSTARLAAGTSKTAVWTIPSAGIYRLTYWLDNTVNASYRPGIQGFYGASDGVAASASQVNTALQDFLGLEGVSVVSTPAPPPDTLDSGSGGIGAPAVQFTNEYVIVEGSPAIGMDVAVGFHSNWDGAGAYIFGKEAGPGQDQIAIAEVPSASVSISPDGGRFTTNQTVELTASDPAAAIRYTLDGAVPTTNSPLYGGSFTLGSSHLLRASAYLDGTGGPESSACFAVAPLHPNVVLITAANIGFGDLGCFGHPVRHTPNFDRLAADGVRFTQSYNTGPGETANQYSLMTGRYYARSGLPAQIDPDAPGIGFREWTLGEAFRKAGYVCGFIGEWRLGGENGSRPIDQGYRNFVGLSTAWDSNAVPPLVERDCVLNPSPTEEDIRNAFRTNAAEFIQIHADEKFLLQMHWPVLDADNPNAATPAGAGIIELDKVLGEILAAIEAENIRSSTVILFASTGGAYRHDPLQGGLNGILRDGYGTTWEGGVRIPAILAWPSWIEPGQSLTPWGLADAAPALAALAGVEWMADGRYFDGRPRLPVFSGLRRQAFGDEVLPFHINQGDGNVEVGAIRRGKWKLHKTIETTDPDMPATVAAPRLHNVEEDPSELFNRYSGQSAVVADMESEIDSHASTFTAENNAIPSNDLILDRRLEMDAFVPDDESATVFRFRRPADLINDYYWLETSSNLSQWSAHNLSDLPFIEKIEVPEGERVIFSPFINQDSDKEFFRLKAGVPQ